MILVSMNYKAAEGKREEFIKVFRELFDLMIEQPGHEESHLFAADDEPNLFLINSKWYRKEDFDRFVSSQEFRDVVDEPAETLLAQHPQHTFYTPVDLNE
jgi:heme-degrading monooxygenase HmoA